MKAEKIFDCLVAGEANVDLLLQQAPKLQFGKEKTCPSFEIVLGGSSAITAHNLAKLGTRVSFIGVVGQDLFGGFVQSRLASASVDLSHFKRLGNKKTGISIWHNDARQNRAGITYLGTIPLLRAADIETSLAQARHLHVGHYFLLQKLHKRAPALFRAAQRLGLTTSLDCNYDPTEQWNSGIREVLRYTDIFFPNEDEAKRLTKKKSALAAARELGALANTVAVKLGSRGALVYSRDGVLRVPAKRVQVADTIGAGDSFNAGYLSRFLQGGGTNECACAGIAAAAHCVTRVGGTAAFEGLR